MGVKWDLAFANLGTMIRLGGWCKPTMSKTQTAICGSMEITVEGNSFHLSADGTDINLNIKRPLPKIRRPLINNRSIKSTCARLSELLSNEGFTLKIDVEGHPLAIVGTGANTSLLSRVLGIPKVQITDYWRTLAMLFRWLSFQENNNPMTTR